MIASELAARDESNKKALIWQNVFSITAKSLFAVLFFLCALHEADDGLVSGGGKLMIGL